MPAEITFGRRIKISKYRIHRTVLYGDCDPAGVIYSPRACHFIVEAVLDFQEHCLKSPAARAFLSLGLLPAARKISIEYLAPLTWDDEIVLEVVCANIGTSSFTCEVKAFRTDQTLALTGLVSQVCVSEITKKPVPIPEKIRLALQQWL